MKINGQVAKILANYESDNPGTKANLARVGGAERRRHRTEADLARVGGAERRRHRAEADLARIGGAEGCCPAGM